MEKLEASHTAGGNVNSCNCFGKQAGSLAVRQKVKQIVYIWSIRGCDPSARGTTSLTVSAWLVSCTASVAWLPCWRAPLPFSLSSLCAFDVSLFSLLWCQGSSGPRPAGSFPALVFCLPAWTPGNRPSLEGPRPITRIDTGGNNSYNIKKGFLEC